MVNKTPTNRQMPTKNWLFNYWTKLLDGYSPKIELKFLDSLRFAVFLQIRKSDKFIAKIRNSKTYLPSPSRPTVETLLNAAPGKISVGFSFWIVLGMQDLLLIFESQIFNNVRAQKKTVPEFPCGLNSVEKYFCEVGSFSGVIRVHVVIFGQIQWERWRE